MGDIYLFLYPQLTHNTLPHSKRKKQQQKIEQTTPIQQNQTDTFTADTQ